MRGTRPERALVDAILREGIVRTGERIVVACSGGPDSVALAWALAGTAAELDLRLQLVYVDHARRRSSLQDECVVAAASATLGLEFRAVALEHISGGEAALREARYAVLREAAGRFDAGAIATAHHAEDQSETVLLALFRGTGAAGIAGMPARRPLEPGLDLVRPLLAYSARDLLAFCQEIGAPYAVDPTNADTGIARNGVRQALDALRPLFPQLDRAVARAASIAADEAHEAPRAGLRRLVRARIERECGLADVAFEHVEAAVRALERKASGRFYLKPGIELEVCDGAISAVRSETAGKGRVVPE